MYLLASSKTWWYLFAFLKSGLQPFKVMSPYIVKVGIALPLHWISLLSFQVVLPYISKVCIVLPLIFKDLVVSPYIFKNSVAPLCFSKVWTELPLYWVGSPQILEVLVSPSHIFKLWVVSSHISKVWYSSFYTFKKYHSKKPMHIHCKDAKARP